MADGSFVGARSRTRSILTAVVATLLVLPGLVVLPDLAGAQVAPGAEDIVSPGGAFLRSLAVPGWGHVATESPGRGAFYVAAQSGSLWMLWKSFTQRATARTAEELTRDITIARLESQGLEPGLADQDPAVQAWEEVLESRDQQVEDWAALSIFLVLIGAADAYVTAHLKDFPEPLSLRAVPNPATGGFDVGISVPLGGRGAPSGSR